MAQQPEEVRDILEKKESGEKLTRQEAGKLGGHAYKAQERAQHSGMEAESVSN